MHEAAVAEENKESRDKAPKLDIDISRMKGIE